MKSLVTIAFLSLALVLTLCDRRADSSFGQVATKQDAAQATLKVYREVFKKPFDQEAIKAYMAALPKVGDYFVVEGDLLMTEQELRAYILEKSIGEKIAKPDSPELLINKHKGRRDYYEDPGKRSLTYAVDFKSFTSPEQYNQVVSNMERAGRDWENACPSCGIRFIHQSQLDSSPSQENVSFIVRRFNANGEYLAHSFYPHDDSVRRFLDLDPIYFKPQVKSLAVGILRHELGHVLGYRHENLSDDAPGCFKEKSEETDHQWSALTPYDSKSVMHYFCGLNETGKQNPTMELSELDRVGHRSLYKLSPDNPSLAALSAAFSLPDNSTKPRTLHAYETVFEKPFDQDAIRDYMNVLPRDGDYFVVEGDILLTEQELRAYVVAKSLGTTPADPDSAELIVNTDAGKRDYYKDPSKRSLNYAVDRKSFPSSEQYTLVVNSMQQAGQDWASACPKCGIRFVYQPESDNGTSTDKQNFVVRWHDSGGKYIAASFFPHDDSSRRYLNVDPSYFRADLQPLVVGVFRHELGHVLGYRHEHTRDVSGCYFEDNLWEPLTEYDSKSVMHYFCGGGGNAKLELSKLDREGHTKLYGNFNSPSFAYLVDALRGPELIVHFEGGDLSENSAKVLTALTDLNLIQLRAHRVTKGETLETIYSDKLQFPFYSTFMRDLADNLNKTQLSEGDLKPGKKIIFPDIDFTNYDYRVQLDPKSRKDNTRLASLRADWSALILKEQPEPSGLLTLTLNGYELKLKVDSYETLAKAKARLNDLKLSPEHVLIITSEPKDAKPKNIFFTEDSGPPTTESADEFWDHSISTNVGKVPENLQGDLAFTASADRVAVNDYRSRLKRCDRGASCPDVVLIDQAIDRHPDIAEAVSGGNDSQGPKSLVGGNHFQIIEDGGWDGAHDHGTYMAGIIASKDNGFGLIGMDPNARITPLLWASTTSLNDDDGRKLIQNIERRYNQGGLQIFVFASSWPYDETQAPRDRIAANPMARKIKNLEGLLWVVAAGQSNSGLGEEIHDEFRSGPMNLGRLPNVLVVTGYSLSPDRTARLLPDANYSKELVHIAAPGKDEMSTVKISKYARSKGGTSPATAFVAGVASAMAGTWDYYNRADKVKFRLQLTATPLSDPADTKKIVSGTLNPALALYNPTKTWLKIVQEGFAEVTPDCWSLQSLNFRDPVTNLAKDAVTIDLVRRIYRVPNSNPAQWFIYEIEPDPDRDNEPKKGFIKRVGPYRIAEEDSILFMTSTGAMPLRKITDLILPEVNSLRLCQ